MNSQTYSLDKIHEGIFETGVSFLLPFFFYSRLLDGIPDDDS